MPIHTLGQPGRGAIYHKGIGNADIDDVSAAVANVEVAMNGAPEVAASRSVGRRASLIRMGILSAALMLPGLGMAQTVAAKSPQAASAPAAADPIDTLREKLAAKLGTAKAPEAPSPYVVRVVPRSPTAVTQGQATGKNETPKTAVKVAQPIVKSDNMTEAQMDELDNNKKLIYGVDGDKERLLSENHTAGMGMPVEKIKQYIDEILERAVRTKHGAHMQEHENAMWVIDYFNQMKVTDERVMYYPSKVGDDSAYVRAFKAEQGKAGYIEKKYIVPTKSGPQEMTIYMNPGNESIKEIIKTLPKERAVRATVDVGTAYVILPKGTPIIEQTKVVNDKEIKTYLIAACRNEIFQALSECPPAGALLPSK